MRFALVTLGLLLSTNAVAGCCRQVGASCVEQTSASHTGDLVSLEFRASGLDRVVLQEEATGELYVYDDLDSFETPLMLAADHDSPVTIAHVGWDVTAVTLAPPPNHLASIEAMVFDFWDEAFGTAWAWF